MGYIYVWEHFGGGRHIDADWSPNFEDLYSPELDFMDICVARSQFKSWLSPKSHSWRRVGGRLIRAYSYQSSDSSVEMSDELASILASIKEIESSRQDPHPVGMVTDETVPHASQTAQALLPRVSLGTPFHLADHYETIPPPTIIVSPPMVPTIEDTRLAEQERWFASVEPSRLCTWEDVAHEFLTQFAFNTSIDVSRRVLKATRQRLDESISSFVSRWRANVAGMIDQPKEQDQIDMDLKSLVHAAFSVKEAIARGLWTYTTPSPNSKGKKPFGSSSRLGEVSAITYHHQRLTHHSPYRSLTVRAHFSHPQYQYQPVYVLEPYIAQTSTQPQPPHPRATTHLPPRPYAQWAVRQFTPLGITLTRAFEKLKDGGLIVPLAPRPLPHPIPPHFRSHEHCLYHHIQGHDTECCLALHHAIQDLIDLGLVNLVGLSVTTNPLPTHSTHAVPPPLSLQ
uniref:Retrotransposon gag domain-containing protein n=1 Tax=Vitis vinifera TaxID=29760 RepID=A5CBS0_VITVI|nr:hypothetical protein VITISV_028549 [Vitis vinifera]